MNTVLLPNVRSTTLNSRQPPPFPEQKEKQPGMVNTSACHSANVLQLSLQGSLPGVRG